MTTESRIDMNLSLAFPKAEIIFVIKISGETDDVSGFHLHVTDLSGNAISFTRQASVPLADWVRGYTRWLYRSRISATHDVEAITGKFASGLTVEQVLEGVQGACDMIRQRFELYDATILE